jgi:O-antigen/teichoic acid export membrane protein
MTAAQATAPHPSVARQSVWSVSSQGLIVLLGAATSVLLNRVLGPEGRGIVSLVLLWPPLLAGLVSAGWAPALGRSMSACPEDCRAYWSAAQLVGLVAAALTCAAAWFLLPWLMKDTPDLWGLARLFLFHVPIALLALPAVSGLEALRRFDLSGRVRVGNLLGVLGLLAALTSLRDLTPRTYCVAVLAVTALTTLYGLWLFRGASSGAWHPRLGPLPAYVLRAAPLEWAQAVGQRADQVAIVLLAPTDLPAFGAYVVGTRLAGMVLSVSLGLSLVLLPESARRSEPDAYRLLARMARLFLLGALALGLPLAAAAPWVLEALYGADFGEAAYAVRLGLLAAVLSGLFSMGLSTLQGVGKPGAATLVGIAGGLLSLLGSAAILPALGYAGAAAGQALGMLAGLALLCAAAGRHHLPLRSLLPGLDDGKWLWAALKGRFGRNRLAPLQAEAPASFSPPERAGLRGDL